LIQASSPYEDPELTRDILVDFIHGNALSVSNKPRKRLNGRTKEKQTEQFRESLTILFHRLFYNTRLT